MFKNSSNQQQTNNQLKQAKSHQGEVWSGYLELLRAEGFCQSLIQLKQQESQGEGKAKGTNNTKEINWGESETDVLLRELQDTELHFKVKLQLEKKTVNFIYCSGFSNTGCLGLEGTTSSKISLIPQIKNRQVLSVACGDHHTIALVKAFPSSLLFSPNYGDISKNFDHSYEIFGWGQNTCGQITGDSSYNKIIEKPLILSYFSGKSINAVAAHKASSVAIDLNGAVYEWGANKFNNNDNPEFEQTFQIKQKEIVEIYRGQTSYAVLDSNQQCYWWGKLKDLEKKDLQCTKLNGVTSIGMGSNHILLTDKTGKAYGLGDNSKGQLSLGYKCQFASQFEQIDQLKGSKVLKARAFQDASLFFTEEGVLYYTGQISTNKNVDYIKEAEFSDNVKIINGSGYDGQLYALSSSGVTYVWEPETAVKFKLHKDVITQTFRDLYVGSGFQIMTKSLPNAKISKAYSYKDFFNNRLINNSKLKTYETINIQVELRDQNGLWGLKPFYPMRYQLLLSEKRNMSIQEVEILAQNFTNMTSNQYVEEKIYVDEIADVDKDYAYLQNVSLCIENAGVYYLYVLLNEEMIGTQPIELRIQASEAEKQRKDEILQLEENRRNAALERQRKEQERVMKMQEELDEEKRQYELAEQKKKETEERAREAYQKYLKDQQDKKTKDEEERKRRNEISTGGGFDLDKLNNYNTQKQQQQPPTIQQQPSIQKQSSIKESTSTNASQLASSQQKISSSKNSFTSFEKGQKPSTTSTTLNKRPSLTNNQPAVGTKPLGQTSTNIINSTANKPGTVQSTNKPTAGLTAQKPGLKQVVKKK